MFKFLSKLFGAHKAESNADETRKVDLTSIGCTPEEALSLLLSRLVSSGDLRSSSGGVYFTVSSFIQNHKYQPELESFSNESLYEFLGHCEASYEINKFIARARMLRMRIRDEHFSSIIYE